jgi:short-subunit dehydrogenase
MNKNGRALVTGASAGIGAAYVRHLAGTCAEIVVVARRAERLEDLRRELADACDLKVLTADLTQVEGQARVVEAIRQGPPLDLLVNNAGFSTLGPFAQSDLDDELRMLRLHEMATLAITRAALPAMIEAGRGGVINVASIGGLLAMPSVATYGATKAFLISFSRSLRVEVAGAGLRVQCLCPGYTRTEIHSRDTFRGFDVSRVPEDYWMDADEVVRESLAALAGEEDRWLVVTGEHNRALVRKGLAELIEACA